MAVPGLSSSDISRFWDAFTSGFAMTMAVELGDKTFCIAAIMAMQRSKHAVFVGVGLAAVAMTVLSVVIGHALPSLLPPFYTHLASIVLFFYFGIHLIWESRSMSPDSNTELEEAEEELAASVNNSHPAQETSEGMENATTSTSLHNRKPRRNVEQSTSPSERRGSKLEKKDSTNGGSVNTPNARSKVKATHDTILENLKSNWATITSLFTMTFLAEWGDRSQISTIAMSSSKDLLGVMLGGSAGQIVCTAIAVMGGRILASKMSERTLSVCGGALFLLFAMLSIFSLMARDV